MKEKMLLSMGIAFTIQRMHKHHDNGETEFIAKNKVLRMHETFELKNTDRETLCQIQERKMRALDDMSIEDGDGSKVAEIKKKVMGVVVRDNCAVKVRGDTNWVMRGSMLEHDFTINENGHEIVSVHKKWIAPVCNGCFIDINKDIDEARLGFVRLHCP